MSYGGSSVSRCCSRGIGTQSQSSNHTSLSCIVIVTSLLVWQTSAFQGAPISFRAAYNHAVPLSRHVINASPRKLSHLTHVRMSSNEADPNDLAEDILEHTPSVVRLPSMKQLIIFIFTTVLVWTSEPLLSIVDSAVVGSYANRATQSGIPSNLASVVQLAALGPATMLCDSAIYLTYFIGLAATNKLARASAKNDWRSMIEVSSHSLGVSVALSVIVLFGLMLFGEPLLKSIIGHGGAVFTDAASKKTIDLTAEVVQIGLGYTYVRAIAAGFAITGSTAQSLLLCVLDTPTVTMAVFLATVLNTIGDVYLVAYRGMGVLGAALSTSIATIASNVLLITKGRSLIKQWRLALWTETWGEESSIPSCQTNESKDSGDENNTLKEYLVLPFISLPHRHALRSLILLAGPIFLIMLAKMIEFWYMTTGANTFGLLSTACHNLLMKIFLFFAVFADGISQASQTFLPGLFVKQKNASTKKMTRKKLSRASEADQVICRLSIICTAVGAFTSFVACCIANNAGRVFTSDKHLITLMSSASIYMGANLLLNPLAEMLEGVMIAAGEIRYLLVARGILLASFLGALKMSVSSFTDIWATLIVFQSIKILLGLRFCVRRRKAAI